MMGLQDELKQSAYEIIHHSTHVIFQHERPNDDSKEND
jgi:CHAT domain-containing protein